MNAFHVWVRPLGHNYLVCVDGTANADWLLNQLSRAFVFRSAEPIHEERGTSLCTFHVPYDGRLPVSRFRKLLAAIPQVMLLSVDAEKVPGTPTRTVTA